MNELMKHLSVTPFSHEKKFTDSCCLIHSNSKSHIYIYIYLIYVYLPGSLHDGQQFKPKIDETGSGELGFQAMNFGA